MEYITKIILKIGKKIRVFQPENPMTIFEIRELFYKILGWNCDIEVKDKLAIVDCERRKIEREQWKTDFSMAEEAFA